MFVSESKFLAAPADFIPHILAKPEPNRTELANLITKPEVEAALLVRLEQKASVYGQDLDAAAAKVKSGQPKIDVNEVVRLYQQFVIPITKDVEVEYLVKRYVSSLLREKCDRLQDTEVSDNFSNLIIDWTVSLKATLMH